MTTLQENERLEYEALMARGRDAEWTSQISWVVCGVAATTLLAWGIATRNSTLMLPVVLATAYGFYAMLRGRQQVRLIAGYVEEFFESNETGARWFTWLGHLRLVPGLKLFALTSKHYPAGIEQRHIVGHFHSQPEVLLDQQDSHLSLQLQKYISQVAHNLRRKSL